MTIEQIINHRQISEIGRYSYMPYDMDIALSVFKKKGEQRAGQFIIDQDNKFVIENLIRWAHGDKTMRAIDCENKEVIPGDLSKGIYIAGPTGTGKSLLLEILSSYLTIDDVRASFRNSVLFLTYPCYTTNKVCYYYSETGELYKFLDPAVICFQDLGSEQRETLYMGTRTKVMQMIIQERSDARGNITLFSSNNGIEDKDTYDIYGDRIVSRLKKMCNYFELRGLDRRKILKTA